MIKKAAIFSVLFLFGLFALHAEQALQDEFSPKSEETTISSAISVSLKILRLEDKEGERGFSRAQEPLAKECAIQDQNSAGITCIDGSLQSLLYPADNSYHKQKIEILSSRSHPPTL